MRVKMFSRLLSKKATCPFSRGLLSRIATLFDPLQCLAPYIIRAKLALQEAWLRGPGCEFPDDLKLITYQWAKQLP